METKNLLDSHQLIQASIERRKKVDRVFSACSRLASVLSIIILAFFLGGTMSKGIGWINWQFLTGSPSRFADEAGVFPALVGSLWLIILTLMIAVPLGIATAIYLEEYGKRSRFAQLVAINISNLAGVPSIIYGILGLAFFVRILMLGRSILAGSLTMSLVILPVIIIASQEALKSVPKSIREASLSLGATKWQTVRHAVLPSALPGILTGIILALARAIGETAPLITIGALSFIAFVPRGPLDPFTVLPIQIYNWASRPQKEFQNLAAAAIIVLLFLFLLFNALAIILRHRTSERIR